MKNFIVYDSNGNILRTGQCPDSMVSIQANTQMETVIEGIADDRMQKIVNGKVVDRPPEEIPPDTQIMNPILEKILKLEAELISLKRRAEILELSAKSQPG